MTNACWTKCLGAQYPLSKFLDSSLVNRKNNVGRVLTLLWVPCDSTLDLLGLGV